MLCYYHYYYYYYNNYYVLLLLYTAVAAPTIHTKSVLLIELRTRTLHCLYVITSSDAVLQPLLQQQLLLMLLLLLQYTAAAPTIHTKAVLLSSLPLLLPLLLRGTTVSRTRYVLHIDGKNNKICRFSCVP